MSTLREAAIGAMGALETARNGLAWYRDRYPESTDGSDDEAAGDIDAAIDALRAELAKPDARPAPAEPQPIAAWSIVRTAESAVVTAVRAALSAAPAPQPAGGEPQPAAQQEPVVTVWQARVTHDSKSAWRQVAPTKTEPTVEARVEYLKTVRRAGGEPAYEFRALYTSPPQVQRAGLSEAEKRQMWLAATIELCSHENCYRRGIADAERHHGISPAGADK